MRDDSFSIAVIKRMLVVLSNEGQTKKTALAGKTGLNYATLMRYLEFLKLLQWIDYSHESGMVSLTEAGRQFHSVLSDSKRPNPGGPRGYIQSLFQMLPSQDGAKGNGTGTTDRRPHVLLIDDEPDALFTYNLFLGELGFEVDAFSDPYSALERFGRDPKGYNLVITDIRMNPLNGLQVFKKVKAANPDARVIFISALDAASELVSILPGVETHDVLRKPVERDLFLQTVRDAIVEG